MWLLIHPKHVLIGDCFPDFQISFGDCDRLEGAMIFRFGSEPTIDEQFMSFWWLIKCKRHITTISLTNKNFFLKRYSFTYLWLILEDCRFCAEWHLFLEKCLIQRLDSMWMYIVILFGLFWISHVLSCLWNWKGNSTRIEGNIKIVQTSSNKTKMEWLWYFEWTWHLVI